MTRTRQKRTDRCGAPGTAGSDAARLEKALPPTMSSTMHPPAWRANRATGYSCRFTDSPSPSPGTSTDTAPSAVPRPPVPALAG